MEQEVLLPYLMLCYNNHTHPQVQSRPQFTFHLTTEMSHGAHKQGATKQVCNYFMNILFAVLNSLTVSKVLVSNLLCRMTRQTTKYTSQQHFQAITDSIGIFMLDGCSDPRKVAMCKYKIRKRRQF